ARAAKVKELKLELKAHNGKYVELQPGWLEVRNLVIPARQAWLRAKGTGEEAALKEAYDQASAASQETIDAEADWNRRKLEIEDAIAANGG
ncbi:MAG: hypothetical protein P1V36_09780, partial [Planctomycetota bacterium]|nr:hypothetical protein [Planctomycetota bacterium]